MASLRTRLRADGGRTYSVLWRDDVGTQRTMSFPDDRQAADNFRRILDANHGDLSAARAILDAIERKTPTLAQVAEQHITGLVSVSQRARVDYRRQVTKHITPTLGAVPVDRLTTQQVRDWLNAKADGKLADKTIANIHGLLSAILSTAVERGYRTDNPCRGMRLPRNKSHERLEMTFLTHDEWHEVDKALGEVVDGHYQLAFRTLAATGMRWGELGGLRVGDLSLNTSPATIRISRALKRDATGAMYIGPTKTRRSLRSISIPDTLADQLREHVDGRKADESVFTSVTGRPLDQHYMRTDVWLKAVAQADIGKRPRIHDLRHSHASWLIAAGVDLLTVQRRLGHESITTTADTYSHLLPGQQQSAADAIAAAMG